MSEPFLDKPRFCGKDHDYKYAIYLKTGFPAIPDELYHVCDDCLTYNSHYNYKPDVIRIAPLKRTNQNAWKT